MSEDEFDQVVDDATHAVMNAIPSDLFAKLEREEVSDWMVQVNDALTPILRDMLKDEG